MAAARDQLDSVRRRNLSSTLGLVHHGLAASRAQLTAQTGLNRSTTGDLVAELVGLGLVLETDPSASNRVGRPSPRVEPDPRPVVIAVNPEVDAITASIVGLGARVEHRIRREVDRAPTAREAAGLIAGLVGELRDACTSERRFLSIGLAVPGLVRAADGMVRWAPHLGWREEPFAQLVQERTGLPAVADNDATVGALAERQFGAGRGIDELIYLNGGASGIGGGVVVRGMSMVGAHGYSGEFGQTRPGLRDPADRATVNGTLEDEVSRSRLLELLGLARADEPTLRAALATSTDAAVHRELGRQQRVLAVALANAINVFNPGLVVLGGFLTDLLSWSAPALENGIEAATVGAAWEGVRIEPAALGENRLLIGAAEVAFESLLRDPVGFAASA